MALGSVFKVLLQCLLETCSLLQTRFVSILSNSGNVRRFSSSLWLCPHFSTNTVLSNRDHKRYHGAQPHCSVVAFYTPKGCVTGGIGVIGGTAGINN